MATDDVTFERIAPVGRVRDLDAAMERRRRLGFAVDASTGGPRYGFVDRGGVSLHVNEWHGHDPKRSGAHVYIDVSDADALHREWAAAGVEGDVEIPSTPNTACGSSGTWTRRRHAPGRLSAEVGAAAPLIETGLNR